MRSGMPWRVARSRAVSIAGECFGPAAAVRCVAAGRSGRVDGCGADAVRGMWAHLWQCSGTEVA